ncbi:unnamed protein product [Protopolystoma xenopodis]|uniref:Uncharacterized protein n=1 Tax=Protopolystoma xenopodis TaxID=117903 RepID=A0A448XGW8_9PLAT|nr:unnamed protein product [Protopolystoma xenopodis]
MARLIGRPASSPVANWAAGTSASSEGEARPNRHFICCLIALGFSTLSLPPVNTTHAPRSGSQGKKTVDLGIRFVHI